MIKDTSDVVLFAGGTGITAFTAFLDGLMPAFQHTVYLAYGARNRRLLIYRDMVQRRAQTIPQLDVCYFIEQDTEEQPTTMDIEESNETIGRLSVAAVWPRIRDPFKATYYISGPPLMLKAVSRLLRGLDIRAEAIRVDAWE